MSLDRYRLISKLKLLGEDIIITNTFGIISRDDKGYKVYVGDRYGRFSGEIISRHYREFAVFDKFIIMTEDVKYNGKTVVHKAVFVEGINIDILSKYRETHIWSRIIAENSLQLNIMIDQYQVYGRISLVDVREVIGVTSNTKTMLVNYNGDMITIPGKLDKQMMGVNYTDGVYKILYISRLKGTAESISIRNILEVDRNLNEV